jgi:internalin A
MSHDLSPELSSRPGGTLHPPGAGHRLSWFLLVVATLAATLVQAEPLFPDPGLEAAVRRQVFAKRESTEPLVEADVVNVSTVDASGRDVGRLNGLEKCRNLAMLDLAGNRVVDLSPLAGLTRLQFLDVQSNRVENLQSLATLPALQYLHLARNQVRDLGPLAGLTNLSALYVSGNRVEDLAPLLGLRRLASLYLDDNRLRSFEVLGRLPGLSTLSLSGNRLADLRPLAGLNSLQLLFLERNRIQDLSAAIEWVRSDHEQRFAPFLQIYLDGNPLSSTARRSQLDQLRASGARVHRKP